MQRGSRKPRTMKPRTTKLHSRRPRTTRPRSKKHRSRNHCDRLAGSGPDEVVVSHPRLGVIDIDDRARIAQRDDRAARSHEVRPDVLPQLENLVPCPTRAGSRRRRCLFSSSAELPMMWATCQGKLSARSPIQSRHRARARGFRGCGLWSPQSGRRQHCWRGSLPAGTPLSTR